jgi:hypothetical protein
MLPSKLVFRPLPWEQLTRSLSIELDGSLVKPNSRRWHHSIGNALWHTVRRTSLSDHTSIANAACRTPHTISNDQNTPSFSPMEKAKVPACGRISRTPDLPTQIYQTQTKQKWRTSSSNTSKWLHLFVHRAPQLMSSITACGTQENWHLQSYTASQQPENSPSNPRRTTNSSKSLLTAARLCS